MNGYRSKCLSLNIAIKTLSEVQTLIQAQADGRLYNLPLKPGDTIYRPEALQFCWVITKVEIYEDEILFIDDSNNIFTLDDIGKTVFLTREEAEKALEAGNENRHRRPSARAK